MLQNARAVTFTVSVLFRENKQGPGGEGNYPHTQIKVKVGHENYVHDAHLLGLFETLFLLTAVKYFGKLIYKYM